MDKYSNDAEFQDVSDGFQALAIKKNYENMNVDEAMSDLMFDISNKKLKYLCKIAYENIDNKELAEEKMREYLDSLPSTKQLVKTNNSKDAELLKKVVVLCCFLTDVGFEKFFENEKESKEFEELLHTLILQRTNCVITNGETKIYDLVPIESYKDEYGSWQYDPFAGHLKLFAKMESGASFPKIWKLDKTSLIEFSVKSDIPSDLQQLMDINMPLQKFLEIALPGEDINNTVQVFENFEIKTVKNLKTMSDEGWRSIEQRIPAFCSTLKTEVGKLYNPVAQSNEKSKPTAAEQLHDWHKFKLFLYYNTNQEKYKKLSFLDQKALNAGFAEQKEDKTFDIGSTIDKIHESLKVYTTPQKPKEAMRGKSNGMLFYGPPGTGKTELSKIIIKKAGLAQIVEPLSSAELNRSLVGATEKLLMDIFRRATYCPHLLCCVAIDEVDALTPKRNDKAAGHKVDALSLLLSLIGGIKHIPNVFVIASTNRLNKIDEAFSRRLQDKFYIGRLTNKQRNGLLSQIVSDKAELPEHVKIDFDDVNLTNLMAKLTTNFSGAALGALRSRILIYFDLNKENKSIKTIDKDFLMKLTAKVAEDFQIKLGRYSIPELMQQTSSYSLNTLWDSTVKNLKYLSGRVLIDLRDNSANMGFEILNRDKLHEVDLKECEDIRYVSQLIPIILDFCVKFKIDNIQLIDSDTLLTASAFDETAINELVNEALEEFNKYESGMIVFDVDTLVGVVENLSESFNDSKSYSLQNQRLWQNILHACKRSFDSNNDSANRKWCVLISSSRFIIQQFNDLAKFPLSAEARQKKQEEEEKKHLNANVKIVEYPIMK